MIARLIVIGTAVALVIGAQPQDPDDLLAKAKTAFFEQGARAVLPQFERALDLYRQAKNPRGEAIALGYIGFSYYNLGDFPKALEYLEPALSMKRRLRDRQEEGKTLGHLGLVYWAMGNYQQSIREHTRSLTIARQLGDKQMEGTALGNLGLVHDDLGEYDRSVQEHQQALALHRATGFVRGETDALANIGGVYELLGRYREALPYYQHALALDEKRNLKPSITLDLGNMGLCYTGMGEVRQALAAFDRALAIARETGQKKEEADWHKGKGSALVRSGKYDEAISEYNIALQVYEHAGLQRELLEALQDLGNVQVLLGDAASAEADFRGAMQVASKIGHPRGVTTSLMALGDLEWRRKRYAQAAALYEDVLARARQSDNREHLISSLVQLSLTYKDQGRTRQALERAVEARDMARANSARALESQALYALAEAERAGGKLPDALEYLADGSEIAQGLGDPELTWRIAYAQGQTLEALNRPQEAVGAYQRAATVIESVRDQLREDRFRAGYIQDKYEVYVSLVRLLLRLGRTGEAFGFAERLRAQGYSALLSHSAPRARSDSERDLRERIRGLRRALDREALKAPAERRAATAETFSTELVKAERQYQNLFDDLRTADPEYTAARGIRVPPIAEIQRQLPQGAALVEYIVAEDRLAIFVLNSARLMAITVPVGGSALRSKVELLRGLISRGSDDWQKPAVSLRRLLIDPIEKAGWLDKVSALYIVPHGVLNYLPFAALPRGEATCARYLVQDYVLTTLPAAAALMYRPKPDAQRSLLAVAPSRSNLPYAQEEARSIGEFFPRQKQILVGASATEASFKRDSRRYEILHLATHGYFNKINPLFSAMQLEPDGTEDGRLEVHEILDLRLNASLVTLSACDTALGSGYFAEVPAGDEFIGLTRAFLYAGSRAVLATLWEVSDRSTVDFMRSFYGALAQSGKPKALAAAQRAMLGCGGRYSHPYYWAPFVLVGQ
ncbi:MAG: hypothetical protein JWO48_3789 [Bryobacterales bacterium]|nr:hypothetical protein [Bryobacterales bacterium]